MLAIALLPMVILASPLMADGWELDEFMISVWGTPTDDVSAQAFADTNFNTVRGTQDTLDLCRKHGLKVIVQDATPGQAAKLAEDEALWGFWVKDEPKAEQFAEVGEKVAAFHEADLTHPAYVNLMAWMDLSDYLTTVRPRFLSYDYYQWWWGTENHCWRLEAHRKAALEAGIPLLCWVEGNADKRWEWGEKGQTYLPDNEPKLRQSVYTSLAYGVKGIQWFNDFVIFQHASGRKLLPQLREAGEDVKQINAELRALGPTLVRLTSTDVFHTEPVPKNTRKLPEDWWLQAKGQSLTLGFFEDSGGTRHVMVVNRDIATAEWAMVGVPEDCGGIEKFDRVTGEWAPLGLRKRDGTLSFDLILRPGDGALLRVF